MRLPNVGKFDITLGNFDPLLLINGITRRLNTFMSFTEYRNGQCNRYLLYMLYRLLKIRKSNKQELYWKTAFYYLNNSNTFLLYSLWYIDKNIYRKLTYGEIRRLLKGINKLRGAHFTKPLEVAMKFHRTYIPKGDTYRPLGVPSLSWRVYSNMCLHLLTNNITLHDTQHGFIPGRGTFTAWKAIFSKIVPAKYVYEIDLRQCFPSISLELLERVMQVRFGIPSGVARFYASLNYAIPVLPKDCKLDEAQFDSLKLAASKQLVTNDIIFSNFDKRYWNVPYPAIEKINRNTYYAEQNMTTQTGFTEPLVSTGIPKEVLVSFLTSLEAIQLRDTRIFRHLEHYVKKTEGSNSIVHIDIQDVEALKFIGTAQGSPLSPFLSAIMINEIDYLLPKGVKVLKYADDMIFYGLTVLLDYVNTGNLADMLRQIGLTIHSGKSGWVKTDGTWLKPLKFLGLTYDGLTNVLRASTRNGSTLIFNKALLLHQEYDFTVTLALARDKLLAKVIKSWKAGVERRFNPLAFLLGLKATYVDYKKDLNAYNWYMHWNELLKIQDAVAGNSYGFKLLAFLRFIMELPRSVIFSLEIRKLVRMNDKVATKKFISTLFDEIGEVKVPLASDFLTPLEQSPGSEVDREAPYIIRNPFYYSPSHISKVNEDLPLHAHPLVWSDPINLLEPLSQGIRWNIFGSPSLHNAPDNILQNVGPTAVSTDVETHGSFFPLYKFRTLFFTEYNNEYVSKYRSKYTWHNFVRSELAGLIVNRLYTGSWSSLDLVQNFKFTFKGNSLAAWLSRVHGSKINVFNGSSIAFHHLFHILKRHAKIFPKRHVKEASLRVRR